LAPVSKVFQPQGLSLQLLLASHLQSELYTLCFIPSALFPSGGSRAPLRKDFSFTEVCICPLTSQ
jgi:hypothetical protein